MTFEYENINFIKLKLTCLHVCDIVLVRKILDKLLIG